MRIGQKYIWKTPSEEEWKSTWIGSIVDVERYWKNNVFCPYSGFCLVNSQEDKEQEYQQLNERARYLFPLLVKEKNDYK